MRHMSIARELEDTRQTAVALSNLGGAACAHGDYERALTLCRESLVVARDVGDNHLNVESIGYLGDAAAARHEPERAARLWGTEDAWREANSVPRFPAVRQKQERMVAQAREQLDEATWIAAWEEGRAMSLERAIQYALGESSTELSHRVVPTGSL